MWEDLPLFPQSASTLSAEVDALYGYLVVVSGFFALLIATLVIVFAVRYRRRRGIRAHQIEGSLRLELVWSILPLLISLSFFVWGTSLFVRMARPPADSTDLYVVGKQWMWKIQHPGGQREINDLHVPVGRRI